jgi:hypothetical protein
LTFSSSASSSCLTSRRSDHTSAVHLPLLCEAPDLVASSRICLIRGSPPVKLPPRRPCGQMASCKCSAKGVASLMEAFRLLGFLAWLLMTNPSILGWPLHTISIQTTKIQRMMAWPLRGVSVTYQRATTRTHARALQRKDPTAPSRSFLVSGVSFVVHLSVGGKSTIRKGPPSCDVQSLYNQTPTLVEATTSNTSIAARAH